VGYYILHNPKYAESQFQEPGYVLFPSNGLFDALLYTAHTQRYHTTDISINPLYYHKCYRKEPRHCRKAGSLDHN